MDFVPRINKEVFLIVCDFFFVVAAAEAHG